MAQFTGIGKATVTPGIRKTSKSFPTSPVSIAPPMRSRSQTEASADDHISKYCCFLQKLKTGDHGSGFVVEFEGLQSGELLALNWERRDKHGELQTNYALITSHDTIPGLPLSQLNGWTVSCQGIEGGNEQTLSDLVCGVISCCGHESLFGPGHSDARIFLPHPNLSCQIELNITILYLNDTFDKKLKESSGCTVLPPVVSVKEHSLEHKQIISALSSSNGREECSSVHVYHCSGPSGSLKLTAVSLLEQQDTSEDKNPTVISQEITNFDKFQKLHYKEPNSSTALVGRCYGSPVVYHNTTANEHTIIGVHVGETDKMGQFYAVTLHRIQQILRGGLIPVLSVLSYFEAPRLWPSRWAYLVTPHITVDQLQIDLGEVLRYLLKDRFGTQLVKLSVDLADVDNKASLDLLCALFKHFDDATDVDLDTESYDEGCDQGISDDIEQLCGSLLNLLEGAAREPKQKEIKPTAKVPLHDEGVSLHDEGVRLRDRAELVEKCFEFYNRLLAIKYAGITERILCTPESCDLVGKIRDDPRYQSTVVDISEIYQKIVNSLESRHKEETVMQQAAIRSPAGEKKQLKQSEKSVQPPKEKRIRAVSESSYFDSTSKNHPPIAEESPAEERPPEKLQVELTTEQEQVQVLEEKLQQCHDEHERKADMRLIESLKAEIEGLRRQPHHIYHSDMETTGYLRGMDVIAETSILITNEAQTFSWKGYGLKLNIPPGVLPAGFEECRLCLKVTLSGQFALPQNTSLVSAVYWLDCELRQKFSKRLTLEIQHCVKPTETSNLSFVRAKCTQTHLPYEFTFMKGGVFSSDSVYGSVELEHFSGLGVVGSGPMYYAHLCYLKRATNMINIHFVITWNAEPHTTVVKKEYSDMGATIGQGQPVEFESNSISLQLPSTGTVLKNGWMICPLSSPEITKEEVDNFKTGRIIPSCQLVALWTGQSKPPVLIHQVTLKGVKKYSNYFSILLDYNSIPLIQLGMHRMLPAGLDNEPELPDLMNEIAAKIPSKWRDVGLQLGLDKGVLDGIAVISPGDNNHCFINVFTRWKNQNSATHPYTWSTVLKALQTPAVGESRLSEEIKKKLTVHPNH